MSQPVTVGLDLGGTKCLALALDGRGEVVMEARRPTPRGAAAIVDTLVATAGDVLGAIGGAVAVGAGVPGLVDVTGVLQVAPNLPGVSELPVQALLAERLGLPVQVDNDATCAAWAERELGAARGADHAVLVTLGTGIGAGIVADGRLYRGRHGFAGEAGHMIVDPNGPRCPCGQRGCWERYASGSGLGRIAREAAHAGRAARIVELAGGDAEGVRGEHVTVAAAEGDGDALTVMETYGWWLALGLANLANLLDPEVFVLGGGLVEAGEVLLEPTRRAFDELVEGVRYREVRIVAAELGERAGAIGAALLARAAGRG